MKKIIISIAALGAMSFTSNQLYYSTQLVYAMMNIEDMKEWIIQDVENNKIDSVNAEYYFEVLDETHGFINDFYEHECK